MLIELDLSEAKSLKLTINQFLLIKLLLNKVDIKSYQNVIHLNNADVELLGEKKILTKESILTRNKIHVIIQIKLTLYEYMNVR